MTVDYQRWSIETRCLILVHSYMNLCVIEPWSPCLWCIRRMLNVLFMDTRFRKMQRLEKIELHPVIARDDMTHLYSRWFPIFGHRITIQNCLRTPKNFSRRDSSMKTENLSNPAMWSHFLLDHDTAWESNLLGWKFLFFLLELFKNWKFYLISRIPHRPYQQDPTSF